MGILTTLFGGGASKADLPALIRDGALLIDARSPIEFASGSIDGAINIPHNLIVSEIGSVESNKERPVVVYCQSGGRSRMAAGALKNAGYTNVENGGGIKMLLRQLEMSRG